MKRVVVTGARGVVGTVVTRGLADGYDVVGIDRRGPLRRLAGGIGSPRAAARSFRGVAAVVHLAADSSADASWRSVHQNNLAATFSVLEGARRAGVARVILASSNQVTRLYERDTPYADIVAGRYDGLDPETTPLLTAFDPVRPGGLYAAGKVMDEALGRLYAEEHGLSVVCLRIGTVNGAGRPREPRHFATFLSHGDLGRLVRCALEAPDSLRFGVFYGVSANRWRFWDLEDAARRIGYVPQDDAESWR
jgi:nucleoside-diphosphate-sugar epimerase